MISLSSVSVTGVSFNMFGYSFDKWMRLSIIKMVKIIIKVNINLIQRLSGKVNVIINNPFLIIT